MKQVGEKERKSEREKKKERFTCPHKTLSLKINKDKKNCHVE